MPEIGALLECVERRVWRQWLAANHDKAEEIWLVYHRKASGKPFIDYDEAVEEALCFGWIDSVIKPMPGTDSRAQRWTPRRPGSAVSALNQARIRKMERLGLMTDAGRSLPDYAQILHPPPLQVPADIEAALRRGGAWDPWRGFPEEYRRVRLAYVDRLRGRPEDFEKALANLVTQTQRGKMFGTIV